jgi:hypothetical protein
MPEAAEATLRRVLVIGQDQLITGPTGKVRKFLMRQLHAEDAMAVSATAAVPATASARESRAL